MKYQLAEIFDIEELKRLCENFTNLNGTVTAILDLEGNILVATGWQQLCTQFHRKNHITNRLCTESDTLLAGQLKKGEKYNVYKCKNGLVDVAMPIMIENEHVANFFTGQFLFEKPNVEFFSKQAQTYGFNESEYLSALNKIPIFSEDDIKKNISFLVQLTEIIGKTGFKNLQLREQKELTEANEEKFKSIVNSSPTAMYFYRLENNAELILIGANPSADRIIGISHKSLLGKTLEEAFPNLVGTEIPEMYKKVARKEIGHQDFEISYRDDRFTGSYSVHVFSTQNNTIAVEFVDISDKRKAEQALKESERRLQLINEEYVAINEELRQTNEELLVSNERTEESEAKYKSLFSNMINAFSLLEMIFNEKDEPEDYVFLEVNPIWEEIVGIKAETVIGKRIKEIMPNIEQVWLNNYGKVVKTGISEEFIDFNAATNKYYNVFVYKHEGNKFVVIFNDVTDKKIAEIELQKSKEKAEESEAFLSETGEIAKIGGWKIDLIQQKLIWTKEVYRIHEVPDDYQPILEKSIDFYDDNSKIIIQKAVDEAINLGNPFDVELGIHTAKGNHTFVRAKGEAQKDEKGTIEFIIGTFQDITEQKKAEQEIKRAYDIVQNIQTGLHIYRLADVNDDRTLKLIYANPIAEKLTGIQATDIINKTIDENFPGLREKDIPAKYANVVKTQEIIEIDDIYYGDERISHSYFKIKAFPLPGNCVGVAFDNVTEINIAQQALKESEERFRAFFEYSPAPIFIHQIRNEKSKILVNNAFAEFTGYSKEELQNTQPEQLMSLLFLKEDIENEIKLITKLYKGEIKSYSLQKQYKQKAGSIAYGEVNVTLKQFTQTNEIFIIAIVNDITERKKAEQALAESEEKFKTVVENGAVLMTITDTQGRVEFASSQCEKVLGWSVADIIGVYMPDFIHPDDKEMVIAEREKVNKMQAMMDFEYRIIDKQKKIRWISHSTAFIKKGNAFSILSTIINITDRKQAEIDLKKAKEKAERNEIALLKVQEISHVGSWYLNVETNEVAWTEELYKMYNFDPAQPVPPYTEHMKLFTHESWEILSASLAKTQETGIPYELELKTVKKDGNYGWMWVRGEVVKDENRKTIGLWGAAQDITERKLSEEKITAQKNELQKLNADKDRFMKILAHDLKSPFNSILGFSDLLVKNIDKYDKEKIEKQVRLINQTTHKTYHLLEDLLLWTNSQAGKLPFEPIPINISDICNRQIEHIKAHAATKSINLNYFETETISVFADINMVNTVLRNLILNAVKFTNRNGQISVYAIKNHETATITIADNGIGIAQQNIAKIWDITEKYSTTGTDGESGTGFGLLLCKEFVEKHGGRIWVESEVGKGSDFKFTIPLEIITMAR